MDSAVVTLQSGLVYRVTFVAPHPGGLGIEITSYEIVFKRQDGDFQVIPQCDGSSQTVIDNLYCEVNLSLLIDPVTFALELGNEVVVKVRAENFNGFGLSSIESELGALIVASPMAPVEAP